MQGWYYVESLTGQWIKKITRLPEGAANLSERLAGFVEAEQNTNKKTMHAPQVHPQETVDRLHSRNQRPYWFNETKEIIWSISRGSAIPLFWYTNMAAMTSCENDQ